MAANIELTVDPEFEGLCRKLTPEEASLLEATLEVDGCLDPIILWANHDDTILDGHNRYRICTQLGIPFKTKSLVLADRDACRLWIRRHQMAKRNQTPEELSEHRGEIYLIENKGKGGDRKSEEAKSKPQNEVLISTADKLAEEFNVSRATIERDGAFAKSLKAIAEVAPEVKAEILSGKSGLTRKQIQEVATLPMPERAEAIKEVVAKPKGSAVKGKKGANVPEEKTKTFNDVCKWVASRRKPVTKEDIAEHFDMHVDGIRRWLTAANQGRGFYVQDVGDGRYRISRAVHFAMADMPEGEAGDLKTAMRKLADMAEEYKRAKSATKSGTWTNETENEFVAIVAGLAKDCLNG